MTSEEIKNTEWFKIIQEGCHSNLSDAEWCRRNHVNYEIFRTRKKRYVKKGLLDNLLKEIELITCSVNNVPTYVLPISYRTDLRLMLSPLAYGRSPKNIQLKAWSYGAECNDQITYVFCDSKVKNIYLFHWIDQQVVNTVIHLEDGISLKWPKLNTYHQAVIRQKDLIALLKTILPYIEKPTKKFPESHMNVC